MGAPILRQNSGGFTLVELMVVAAIIGLLLAIVLPNLVKAIISANEANARKSMQTLRNAEFQYYEGDLDNDGKRDFTSLVGSLSTPATLRCPSIINGTRCDEQDALIDGSFVEMVSPSDTQADCVDPRAGYCIKFDGSLLALGEFIIPNALDHNFGWLASPARVNKTGRKDFATYADTRAIHCVVSTRPSGATGTFQARKDSPVCD